jgi:hypothetical protein
MADEQTYYIKRHYAPHLNKESHAVEGLDNLTLEEAQDHCNDPSTRKAGEWFDSYHKE